MISVFYIDENRSVERADSCGDFKWAVLEPRWTGGLDNPPALIVSKMVSDEDAPMEIWRFDIHGLSNNNRGGKRAFVQTKPEVLPRPDVQVEDDNVLVRIYLKTDKRWDSGVGFFHVSKKWDGPVGCCFAAVSMSFQIIECSSLRGLSRQQVSDISSLLCTNAEKFNHNATIKKVLLFIFICWHFCSKYFCTSNELGFFMCWRGDGHFLIPLRATWFKVTLGGMWTGHHFSSPVL